MRGVFVRLVILSTAACGGDDAKNASVTPDAPSVPTIDAPPVPTIDAPPACKPTPLLVGGPDVTTQGWKVISQQPATLTNGADFVQLTTSTPTTTPPAGS